MRMNMRPMRRLMAAILAIVMAMSLAIPVFAVEYNGDTCPPGCEICAKFLADSGYKTLASANDAVADTVSFSDVPTNHTFHDAIMYCAEKGIVGGYSDGTFRPANTVTRANFAVMLSRAFYADDVAKYSTESNLKYSYSMPSFVALNYKNLLTNTSFDTIEKFIKPEVVNLGISRYDMAQLMTNIMNEKGFAASSAEKSAVISQIADYSEIPSQYKDAVTNVYALGIIGGFSNGTFGGSGTMTRGQGAIVIYRMVQKSDSGSITNPGTDPEAPVDPSTGEQTCLCKSIYG